MLSLLLPLALLLMKDSFDLPTRSLLFLCSRRYHEYADPVHPARLSTLRHSVHRIDGVGSKTVAAFVEHQGNEWWKGLIKIHPVTGIA